MLRQHSGPVSTFSSHSTQVPDLILANPTAGGGLAREALPRLQKFALEKQWRGGVLRAPEWAGIFREPRGGGAGGVRPAVVRPGGGEMLRAVGLGEVGTYKLDFDVASRSCQ